jgi:zinc D-Ala-D-Ala carboxypeptidase
MELKYFKISEFDSPDLPGSGMNMKPEFLQKLDNARAIAGIPFKINSGFRTLAHNKSLIARGLKAVQNSPHLAGYAADIAIPNGASKERFIIVNALLKAGFTRIGIDKTFVHCDCDPTKDKEVIWLY